VRAIELPSRKWILIAMRTRLALLVLAALLLGACDAGRTPDRAAPGRGSTPSSATGPEPEATAEADRGERAATEPPREKVVFRNVARVGPELRRAIADLKRIHVWRELTSHLYQIDLSVKPGRGNVPKDRHLADARFWRVRYGDNDELRAVFCWVRFFPAAISDDLSRWGSYYDEGLTARVPPSERQMWASILGHELFHCPPRGGKTRPEAAALVWEQRILGKMAASGIE
jgi:hypothetical protein